MQAARRAATAAGGRAAAGARQMGVRSSGTAGGVAGDAGVPGSARCRRPSLDAALAGPSGRGLASWPGDGSRETWPVVDPAPRVIQRALAPGRGFAAGVASPSYEGGDTTPAAPPTPPTTTSPNPPTPTDQSLLTLTPAAAARVAELLARPSSAGLAALRLTVEAGGCSGFSYVFALAPGPVKGDAVVRVGGATLVVDPVSLDLVRGATVDYVQDLLGSAFEVTANPNAEGGCGCGSSFAPKF